jgi:pilus assembly protein Flp/PilA
MRRLNWLVQRATRDEIGQDAAEYALLIALIALAIIVAVTAFGTSLAGMYATIVAQLP